MILASASPRRKELLADAGFQLTVVPANIDESRLPGEVPVDYVQRLAIEKAHEVQARVAAVSGEDLLVAADTIVWTDDDVLGKPTDAQDARRMLAELSGHAHQVSTGVCLLMLDTFGGIACERSFVETTEVEFWPLSPAEIEAYVASGEPMDKAGAYGIQGLGRMLVKGIQGDYFNVVGLPVSRLMREIKLMEE